MSGYCHAPFSFLQDAITNREKIVERDTAKLIEEARAFQKTKGKTPQSK